MFVAVCAWLVAVVFDKEPETDFDAKAVVNATVPPVLAVPLTTRKALLSCVVLFVQPVGAAVCTNNITVPDGNPLGRAEVHAVPLEVNTFPAVPGDVSPVPPLAAGRVPSTWVAKPILPQLGAAATPPEISALPTATSASLASDVVVSA